ncbi:MAG: hypothetical protein R3F01_05390 [Lysobacteraceae bacterium]
MSIVGPGRIEGFRAGVYAVRTQRLALSAIDFDNLDTGALLIHSGGVDLRDSRFADIGGIAVNVMQPQLGPMTSAGGHLMLDNQFANVGSGIQLCGVDTGHALIQRNRFLSRRVTTASSLPTAALATASRTTVSTASARPPSNCRLPAATASPATASSTAASASA